VAADGRAFENTLRAREARNPDFAFMVGAGPEHDYYRWRVFATLMKQSAPTSEPLPTTCRFQRGGPLWRIAGEEDDGASAESVDAPKLEDRLAEAAQDDDKYASRGQRTGDAAVKDVDGFEALLSQTKTLKRGSVREAMFFAIDRADAARQIVDLLAARVTNAARDNDPNQALGLLYVLSDVLHNSGAPSRGCRLYRTLLRPVLPAALKKLSVSFFTDEQQPVVPGDENHDNRRDHDQNNNNDNNNNGGFDDDDNFGDEDDDGGFLGGFGGGFLGGFGGGFLRGFSRPKPAPKEEKKPPSDASKAYRRNVLAVLNAWLRWAHVFPPTFVCGLELTFLLASGDAGDERALRFAPQDVIPNDPDYDALKRDARLSGLDDSAQKQVLERRLGLIRLYVRHRTLGLAAEPALAQAKAQELARGDDSSSGSESEDDDAIDGEAIDDDGAAGPADSQGPADEPPLPRMPRRSRFEDAPPPSRAGGEQPDAAPGKRSRSSSGGGSSSRWGSSSSGSSSGSDNDDRPSSRRPRLSRSS